MTNLLNWFKSLKQVLFQKTLNLHPNRYLASIFCRYSLLAICVLQWPVLYFYNKFESFSAFNESNWYNGFYCPTHSQWSHWTDQTDTSAFLKKCHWMIDLNWFDHSCWPINLDWFSRIMTNLLNWFKSLKQVLFQKTLNLHPNRYLASIFCRYSLLAICWATVASIIFLPFMLVILLSRISKSLKQISF